MSENREMIESGCESGCSAVNYWVSFVIWYESFARVIGKQSSFALVTPNSPN